MPKISVYPDGGAVQDTDQLVIARGGINYSVLGSTVNAAGGGGDKYPCEGRLTLETGVPISTSDQADKTTLYFTPFNGNQIALHDGASTWTTLTFTELSLAVGAFTASKPYDIWIYDSGGTAVMDSTVWTDGSNRATALAFQDGVYVKSGDSTRRYVGTIYIDSGQKVQNTSSKRYVYNYYNRNLVQLIGYNTTNSWTYTTTTWRESNAGTGQVRGQFIVGITTNVQMAGYFTFSNTNGSNGSMALEFDGTTGTSPVMPIYKSSSGFSDGSNAGAFQLAAGFHYATTIEFGRVTCTYSGTNSVAVGPTTKGYPSEFRITLSM